MTIDYDSREMKRSRGAYVAQAALEYFISLLINGSFFAQLALSLEFSDSQVGLITSILSLGQLFQLVSLAFRRKTVKRFVMLMSISNQILFMLLYVVPLTVPITSIPLAVKQTVFIIFKIGAYAIYHIANPKKTNWFMSLVENRQRGRFTAVKEIISLAGGIVFTNVMGNMIDRYNAAGQLYTAFIICAVTIAVLIVLHSITMMMAVEIIPEEREEKNTKGLLKNMLEVSKNKDILKVAILFAIWYVATHATTSFYNTFQIRDLQMRQWTIQILVAIGSVCRIAVSQPLGAIADKYSFAKMSLICLFAAFIAFASVIFATPQTGIVCFAVYNVFYAVALGGINSALINLIYDYCPVERRADSMAFCQSIAGISGFLSTLVMSRVVEYIQSNGNRLFGMNVYAQQITSVVAAIFVLLAIVYVVFAMIKKKKSAD